MTAWRGEDHDDGRGIRPGAIEEQLAHGHMGLTSRRVRLEAAGGSLTLRSAEPSGPVAEVEVPAVFRAPNGGRHH